MKTIKSIATTLYLLSLAVPSYALESSLNVSLGMEHTDNGEKTERNEISDTEQRVAIDFGLSHETQQFQSTLDYNVARNRYDEETQDSNTEVDGALSFTYEAIEGALFFRLDSSTRNIVNNKAALDVADNRQNRTITTFAPEWILRTSSASELSLSVNYSDIRYEESEGDSNRSGASIKWSSMRSKVDVISAQVNYFEVDLDGTELGRAELDYDYYQTYISYAASLSKLQYTISVGYNETRRNDAENIDGGFLNSAFNYTDGASNWSLELGRELTDSSQGNNNGGSDQFSSFQNASGTVDIYETTTTQASWSADVICAACSVDVSFSYVEDDYDTQPRDSEEISARFGVSYDYSRLTKISFDATYSEFTFSNDEAIELDYDRTLARLTVVRQMGRDFSIRAFVSSEERDSERLDASYEELVVGLTLTYSLL